MKNRSELVRFQGLWEKRAYHPLSAQFTALPLHQEEGMGPSTTWSSLNGAPTLDRVGRQVSSGQVPSKVRAFLVRRRLHPA